MTDTPFDQPFPLGEPEAANRDRLRTAAGNTSEGMAARGSLHARDDREHTARPVRDGR